MCGIAGFNLSPTESQLTDPKRLAAALLLEIERRGRDAAGAAWLTDEGDSWIQKVDVPARTLVADLDMEPTTHTAILHTRWATLGEPEDNANNHPIDVGGIVGVHNGMIRNHRSLFGLLDPSVERFGQVDSEAIFALLQHFGAHPTKVLDLPVGSMAIAWLRPHEKRPCLRLARGSGSPLHLGWTRDGSLLFASEGRMLADAAKHCGATIVLTRIVKEGTYLRARDGQVVESGRFTPTASSTFTNHSYSSPSKFAKPKPKPKPRRSTPTDRQLVLVDGEMSDRARQMLAADQRYEQPPLLSRKRWSNGKGE